MQVRRAENFDVSIVPGKRLMADGGSSSYGDSDTSFTENAKLNIADGPPRLAHKTTHIIHEAAEYDETIVFVGNNYNQIFETGDNHLADTKYGVYHRTVVIPQGQGRAKEFCPDGCTHDAGDSSTFYRTQRVAESVADANRVITPKSFVGEDVCAYLGAKLAVEFADAVCIVPDMVKYFKNADYFPDEYQVIVDEESTQNYFRPNEAVLAQLQLSTADFGPPFITERMLGESNIDEIRQREQRKIDDLQRVASRYTNVLNSADFVSDVVDRITDFEFTEDTDIDDFIEHVNNLDFEPPELEGPESEHEATFDRLRTVYGRFLAAPALEATFFEPSLQAVKTSNSELKIRLIPNPTSDYLMDKDFFETAERVWLVGDILAKDFASKIDGEVEYKELPPNPDDLDDLSIFSVTHPDYVDKTNHEEVRDAEYRRRGFITKISRKLAGLGLGHAIFAGSGLRAREVYEAVSPNSYYFSADSELRHYEKATDGGTDNDEGWAVASYAGSTISRGVDLPTSVSIVRSMMFSTGIFDFYSEDNDIRRYCSRMRRYIREIEVHNMMLRGAGQGGPHVAVIPAITLYYGLEECLTEFSWSDETDDIVDSILASLEIATIGDMGEFTCGECGTIFVAYAGFSAHRCVPAH